MQGTPASVHAELSSLTPAGLLLTTGSGASAERLLPLVPKSVPGHCLHAESSPTISMEFGDSLLCTPKENPAPSPSAMGVGDSSLTRAVPRHIPLPVSPAPNHVPLLDLPPSPGAPAHPNPYLRGSTRACGRGWR